MIPSQSSLSDEGCHWFDVGFSPFVFILDVVILGRHLAHLSILISVVCIVCRLILISSFPHAGVDASMLLQPFRKPKRIRTAFSPSQLLRLEHAFEKNHYVVGQERKDLAVSLSLTETQVRVNVAFSCRHSLPARLHSRMPTHMHGVFIGVRECSV